MSIDIPVGMNLLLTLLPFLLSSSIPLYPEATSNKIVSCIKSDDTICIQSLKISDANWYIFVPEMGDIVTPLMIAAQFGNASTCSYLLTAGACPYKLSVNDAMNAASISVIQKNQDLQRILEEHGIDWSRALYPILSACLRERRKVDMDIILSMVKMMAIGKEQRSKNLILIHALAECEFGPLIAFMIESGFAECSDPRLARRIASNAQKCPYSDLFKPLK